MIGKNIMPHRGIPITYQFVVLSLNKDSISCTQLFQTKPIGEKFRHKNAAELKIQNCTYTKK